MLIKQGLRLVHSGSVTQAANKLATINAGAMWDPGVDMSAYAGNDAGSTPHMLILYDHLGNRMQGFIGASGAGLALGAEGLDDPTLSNSGAWSPNAHVTHNEVAGIATWSGGGIGHFQTAGTHVSAVGKLCKIVVEIDSITAGTFKINEGYGSFSGSTPDWTTPGTKTVYLVAISEGYFLLSSDATCDAVVSNISVKQVTDISTNGIHLHSTRGGTNRNVASIDSGFAVNCAAGYTFNIYKCP